MSELEQTPPLTVEELPRFIIDERATDTDIVRRLRLLERKIGEHPGAFQTALTALGKSATDETLEINKLYTRESTLKQGPEDLLEEFFRQRYDYEIVFDEPTERAMKADPEHQKLLVDSLSKTSFHEKGKVRINPEAPEARNAVRRHSLGMYIGRAATWQSQQQKQTTTENTQAATG